MGSVQHLPHGKTLVGWGDVPFISVFDRSGKLVYDAFAFPEPNISVTAPTSTTGVGRPLYPPVGAARRQGRRHHRLRQLEWRDKGRKLEGPGRRPGPDGKASHRIQAQDQL